MGRVMGSESSYRICPSEIWSIVCDGVGMTRMGHPAAPYPSLGSGTSRSTNLGDPLAQDFPTKIEDEIILPKNFS